MSLHLVNLVSRLLRNSFPTVVRFAGVALLTSLASYGAHAQFGNGNGFVVIPGSSYYGWGGIALQSDGKIIAAGSCGATHCVARMNADGSPDTGFGASGTGVVNIPGFVPSDGYVSKVLVRTDGKIVFGGSCYVNGTVGYRFCVARLNASGTFDTSFVGPNATPGSGSAIFPVSTTGDDILNAMTIDAFNPQRLVLVGACNNASYHCIARLDDEGKWDQTFTGPGADVSAPADPPAPSAGRDVFLHFLSGIGKATGVVVQPNNGKIIIVGSCWTSGAGYTDLCMTKLNEDGSLDRDFNGDGTRPGVNPGRILVASDDRENGIDVVLQPDGDFAVLCRYGNSGQFCVYRFNAGGIIDSNFYAGSGFPPSIRGRTVFGTAGDAVALTMAPTGSSVANRLLALGDCSGSSASLRTCVGALTNSSGGSFDGTVDPTLTGPNGDRAGDFNYHLRTTGGTSTGTGPKAIVAANDGTFFVTGTCGSDTTRSCVYKFRVDGALDTSPCNKDFDSDTRTSAASDGLKLVRAMLGVPGSPAIPPGLGYDIDGSNTLTAGTDGLLFTRYMMGFRGSALTSGISFGLSGRTNATDIESYLRNRCGI
ncbi:MAG: hypothetical protein ACRCWJ_01565 [Casimicrobium sp.]